MRGRNIVDNSEVRPARKACSTSLKANSRSRTAAGPEFKAANVSTSTICRSSLAK
jgi:hypothetical protein